MSELVVNKRELAVRVLHCSLPTIDALLDRYPDFPVQSRGSNGVPWEFVAADVTAFIQRKKTEEADATAAATAARMGFFEQFKLPIDEIAGAESEGLSPTQRAAMAQARLREHELAIKAGLVVATAEARAQFAELLAAVAKFLDTLPGQLQRQFALPDAVVRGIRASIDEQRRNFVRDRTEDLLRNGTDG